MTKPNPKSVLSIDIGRKRVGLAGCDPLGITISRLPAIHRKNFEEDIKTLKEHCQKRKVEGLVVGLPLDEKGGNTRQAKYSKRYGQKIAQTLALPIAWVNEHSSSWEAGEKYNLQNDRSGQLDSASAALLLEQWLREGPELKPVHMPAYSIRQVE